MRVNILECLDPLRSSFSVWIFGSVWLLNVLLTIMAIKTTIFFFYYSFFASEVLRRENCCFSLITAPKELILCMLTAAYLILLLGQSFKCSAKTPTSKDVQFFLDVLFQYQEPQTSMGGYVYSFFFFLS